jgi:hypothetical protein
MVQELHILVKVKFSLSTPYRHREIKDITQFILNLGTRGR